MNKAILLAVSAVVVLGFSSCGDDEKVGDSGSAGYSLVINANNIEKLAQTINSVDLETSIDQDVDSVGNVSETALMLKETTSETIDCTGGGSQTSIDNITEESITSSVTKTQCTEDGLTTTGTINISMEFSSEDDFEMMITGDITITGLPGTTSIEYQNLVMSGGLFSGMSMSSTIIIVSDDFSGSMGFSLVSNEQGETFTLKGADNSEYVAYVSAEDNSETCSLNGEEFTCI